MKERNRKGMFRAAESVAYKMKKHTGFDQVSWMAFQEAALEKYDFSTCQRPDGSYYGTGGTCRKGTPAQLPDKKGKKAAAKGGGGESGSSAAGGMAQEVIDEYGLKGKKAAAVKAGMDEAVAASKSGNAGAALDAIDKVVDKAGGDMDTREKLINEVGQEGKPVKITKDLSVDNLALKDDYKAMDPEMRAEIRSAARDYKKGKIDYEELQERLEEPSTSSLAPINAGRLKNAGSAGDYETEIEILQKARWTDAIVNTVDSGANETSFALSQIEL